MELLDTLETGLGSVTAGQVELTSAHRMVLSKTRQRIAATGCSV